MIWLGLAALSSLALVVAGLIVKAYTSTNAPSLTLIQENGVKVLAPLSIPFVFVVIVTLVLRHRRRTGKRDTGIAVWIVLGLLVLLVLLGAFTIGPFIAPIAVFVLLAITSAKPPAPSLEPVTR